MRPRVVYHVAASLDARLDWFSPDLELFYGLVGQWKEDATLTGADTILASPGELEDDPVTGVAGDTGGSAAGGPAGAMTASGAAGSTPDAIVAGSEAAGADPRALLVVVDGRGRVRKWQALRRAGYWRDVVALCSWTTPQEHIAHLQRMDVSAVVAGEDRVDLERALEVLAERFDVRTVRVDSGGTLAGALLRRGLVDEVSVLVYPCLVGGMTPRSFFRAEDLTSADGIIGLSLMSAEALEGGVVWLRYEVEHRSS